MDRQRGRRRRRKIAVAVVSIRAAEQDKKAAIEGGYDRLSCDGYDMDTGIGVDEELQKHASKRRHCLSLFSTSGFAKIA